MTETPRPTPPAQSDLTQPTPTPTPTPTPASVSGDVPVDSWRTHLAETKDAPAAQRHERLGALLDELDSQVGSL
ncbi:hypothetical protein [Brevibacterium spongiae]|uniref:Uncharacterized protein n=1 Tax=Brevibacterium spongiae TaxID=2909672 RepID=A0ABY5SJI7_9MICO|nr:hypothetical protein [Brevibacterium spongiae]UVI34697.1 hypothetical protein L1F31_11190 [Brevibacterium spongiae]